MAKSKIFRSKCSMHTFQQIYSAELKWRNPLSGSDKLFHFTIIKWINLLCALLTMLARLLLLTLQHKQHNSTRRLEFQTHPKPFTSVGLMLCHRCFTSSSACKLCSKQFMLMPIYELPENSSWPQSNAFSGSPGWLFCVTLSVWKKKKKNSFTFKLLHRSDLLSQAQLQIRRKYSVHAAVQSASKGFPPLF